MDTKEKVMDVPDWLKYAVSDAAVGKDYVGRMIHDEWDRHKKRDFILEIHIGLRAAINQNKWSKIQYRQPVIVPAFVCGGTFFILFDRCGADQYEHGLGCFLHVTRGYGRWWTLVQYPYLLLFKEKSERAQTF